MPLQWKLEHGAHPPHIVAGARGTIVLRLNPEAVPEHPGQPRLGEEGAEIVLLSAAVLGGVEVRKTPEDQAVGEISTAVEEAESVVLARVPVVEGVQTRTPGGAGCNHRTVTGILLTGHVAEPGDGNQPEAGYGERCDHLHRSNLRFEVSAPAVGDGAVEVTQTCAFVSVRNSARGCLPPGPASPRARSDRRSDWRNPIRCRTSHRF